jgi:hypothetical protein
VAASVGLSARATVTPKLLQKMIWSGANLSSYEEAAESMQELAEQPISARRIRRQVEAIGEARVAERERQVESLKTMTLQERRTGSSTAQAPELAVVMMDGGRYQRRDHFGQNDLPEEKTRHKHWRESKVGCLLSMESDIHSNDPCEQIPDSFAHASVVREIAKMAEKQGSEEVSAAEAHEKLEDVQAEASDDRTDYESPTLLARDVVASGQSSDVFGWQLESRARQLNFPSAARQAFVADGAKTNWRIQRVHFPNATPIADLIHALSYAWGAAEAVGGRDVYSRWAQLIWQGGVQQVIAELTDHQGRLGKPPSDAASSDPRQRLHRALTYFRNNASHMNYPEYRRDGLPITSSHIESTVKLINRRIKGSEKFWLRAASECVLQLRADFLSDSQPIKPFWTRWQADQSGSNHYQIAS